VLLVEDGMRVGLGTGDTARRFVELLAARRRDEGLTLVCVPTSAAVAAQARALGLGLCPPLEVGSPDLDVDGADEVDPARNLVKGGGGAHTREKIVAASSARVVIVVDEKKLTPSLGTRAPVPVEVIPEAVPLAERRIRSLGGVPRLRLDGARQTYVTDLGNHILDAWFEPIDDPVALEAALNDIPGTLANGLFVGLASLVLVGLVSSDGVRRMS